MKCERGWKCSFYKMNICPIFHYCNILGVSLIEFIVIYIQVNTQTLTFCPKVSLYTSRNLFQNSLDLS